MMTARDVITMAMREARILPAGGSPDSSEIEDGMLSLTGMLGSWQAYANLWRKASGTLILNAGTASAIMPAYVRTITDARVVEGTTERMIAVWDEGQFDVIPNKGVQGAVTVISMSRQRAAVTINIWPRPRADTTLKVEYQRTFDMLTDAADTIDIPDDWLEAVWSNLAVRIHGMYQDGAALSPELVNRAGTLLRELRDDDRPASYFMGGWRDRA